MYGWIAIPLYHFEKEEVKNESVQIQKLNGPLERVSSTTYKTLVFPTLNLVLVKVDILTKIPARKEMRILEVFDQ